jgi:hypothetical protein
VHAANVMKKCFPILALAWLLSATTTRAAGMNLYLPPGKAQSEETHLRLTLIAAGALAVVDGYYTARAFRMAGGVTPQSARNSFYWTSWQAALLDLVAYGPLIHDDYEKESMGVAVLALSSWPTSLTALGLWHGYPDSPRLRWFGIGTLVATDLAILGFDLHLAARGEGIHTYHSLAEILFGGLQLAYGVATALRTDPSDRALVWSMTSLPALITTHGILSLLWPGRAPRSPDPKRASRAANPAPTFNLGLAPVPGGTLIQAFGVW